jgi:hypothetical protein
MNNKLEYGLEGAFKVDLYSGSQFVSSTDYFSNFITPTGLFYPSIYSFVDCFRFLSLGRSSTPNVGIAGVTLTGTTGLGNPVTTYTTSAGIQSGVYIDWKAYVTGGEVSACGTNVSETGPRFYRAWYVPSGGQEVVMNEAAGGLNIAEFMVSPSSGTDPTGKYAFSRVIRNLTIPNGYKAVVSYQLKINIRNTGLTVLTGNSFQTGNAETTNDLNLIQTWRNLSGYYKQVYHGLRCIDSLGMTYIPKLGDSMEPASRNTDKMVWYLSPDNSQFEVNASGGGAQVDVLSAYKSDGLMSYIRTLDLRSVIAYPSYIGQINNLTSFYMNDNPSVVSSIPKETTLSNIRLGATTRPLFLPQVGNYRINDPSPTSFTFQTKQDLTSKSISYATPGVNKFSDAFSDFGKMAVFSSLTNNLPISMTGQNLPSGRKKTLTRRSFFAPISSLGYNTRFGSMVFAYNGGTTTAGDKTYYPMIDCLFFDSSGRSLMPHYRFITGIQLAERGTGIVDGDFFLSGGITGNVFRFVSKSGFFGPYTSSLSDHPLTQAKEYSNLPTGFLFSGAINGSVSGNFDFVSGSGFTGTSGGWGALYGIVVDPTFYQTPIDLALTDHFYNNPTDPTVSGAIFWPTPSSPIKFASSGLKYFDPTMGPIIFDDSSNWISSTQQIVKTVEFDLLDQNYNLVSSGNFVNTVTGVGTTVLPGYFLSKRKYSGENFNSSQWDDVVRNTTFAFTGYVIPTDIIGGKLSGLVWNDQGNIPINSLSFIPQVNGRIVAQFTNGGLTVRRVENLFQSFTQRGYPNGTGGTPLKYGDRASVFFTGFSGAAPLYLTFFRSQGTGTGAWSLMSGDVSITNFCAPSGYALHSEQLNSTTGARLLPNFTDANYYGTNVPTITRGGEYPALSLDNGLEVYLDISWSSPCGAGTFNCNEPV